jgi:hypothetical protein
VPSAPASTAPVAPNTATLPPASGTTGTDPGTATAP